MLFFRNYGIVRDEAFQRSGRTHLMQRGIRIVLAALYLQGIAGAWSITPNQGGHFGLGIIVGEPTGVSGKYSINQQFAIQGALGLSLLQKGFWLSTDFLLQLHNVIRKDGRLPIYLGIGLVFQDRDAGNKNKNTEISLGLRAVVGAEYAATDLISVFGEVSAQPFVLPRLFFGYSLALGARYWL